MPVCSGGANKRAKYNADSVLAGVVLSLGGTVILFIVYCFIRPRHSLIYAPKTKYPENGHKPEKLDRSLFSWIKSVATTSEEDIVEKLGLDAAIFLRFLRMCRRLFLVMSFFACGVEIPINVYYNLKSSYGSNLSKSDAFLLMTPSLVTGVPVTSHLMIGWILHVTLMIMLWRNYQKVVQMRRSVFMSKDYLRALYRRTLMVSEIPQKYRSEQGLTEVMSKFKITKPISQVNIGRDIKGLQKLEDEYTKIITKLESTLTKYLKNYPDKPLPARPQCKPLKEDRGAYPSKVDTIEYYTDRLKSLEIQIAQAKENFDERQSTLPFGFVSYSNTEDANIVAKHVGNRRRKGLYVSLAPRPDDLIWSNLILTRVQRGSKRFWGIIFYVALLVAWIVPNAFIGCFLGDISRIGMLSDTFQVFMNEHTVLFAVLQGFLSPVITTFVFMLWPIIVRRMVQWQGTLTKTGRERDVTKKLYIFFFFNNFFVFTMMNCAWNIVTRIISIADTNKSLSFHQVLDELEFGQQLTTSIIGASSFWVMYLLRAYLGSIMDLLQILSLTTKSFRKHFMSPTPRQLLTWTAPDSFAYASYYNWILFYCSIVLCFTPIQPIIVPVVTLYLYFDTLMKKYLLMYVCVTKHQSDGLHWPFLHNCLLFASFFASLVLICIVWIQGNWMIAMGAVPLPVIIAGFAFVTGRKFRAQYDYFVPEDQERELIDLQSSFVEGSSSSTLESRYLNTALSWSFPVLMVPPKCEGFCSLYGQNETDSYVTQMTGDKSNSHQEPKAYDESNEYDLGTGVFAYNGYEGDAAYEDKTRLL